MKAGQEDRWYVLIESIDENGVADFRIPFASDKTFQSTLQVCAAEGRLLRGRNGATQEYPVRQETLEYIPSVATQGVRARRLGWLTLPDYSGLSGDLAIRIEVTREGEVLRKELLFSTDAKLGQMVLEDLDQGLEMTSPGEGPGPYTDVLSLTIQNGALLSFIQSHYMARPKE